MEDSSIISVHIFEQRTHTDLSFEDIHLFIWSQIDVVTVIPCQYRAEYKYLDNGVLKPFAWIISDE